MFGCRRVGRGIEKEDRNSEAQRFGIGTECVGAGGKEPSGRRRLLNTGLAGCSCRHAGGMPAGEGEVLWDCDFKDNVTFGKQG